MITKLLIANRGEIAVRIIRACQEIGVTTVGVYSEADENALHVRLADENVCIGPAPSAQSYLNIPAVISAARISAADAIHPGYGFLSQNAEFAAACENAGLTFVGPSPSSIARMGSKIEARRLMQDSGVPVVPGEVPDDQSDAGLRRAVERVGLPVVVKASAGGGGKGMRRVSNRAEIDESIQAARREAVAAFGNGTLYVERLIEHAHHVEVQVFGDGNGDALHLFERECSVQRRHQKVIEESPSPSIGPELRDRITGAGVMAAKAVAYRNAGTVEFLVDVASQSFYFLEMNTRLQVEHTVTEQVVGVDLVRAQLSLASGQPVPWRQNALLQRGHAIEARIYAEDPARGFLPQAGRLLLYREPSRPGVRVDSGVAEGDEVSVHYDPLLAKVIATAETRELAIARLAAALRAFPILGIRTNLTFLLKVLEHPRVRAGTADTDFLDHETSAIVSAVPESGVAADDEQAIPPQVRAAIEAHRTPARPRSRARQWDPWNGNTIGPPDLTAAGGAPAERRLASGRAAANPPTSLGQGVGGPPELQRRRKSRGGASSTRRLEVEPPTNGEGGPVYVAGTPDDLWAFWNGRVFRIDAHDTPGAPRTRATARPAGPHSLTAPMPGTVLKVLVQPGARVARGEAVVILEAMKMELPIRALDDASIIAIHCREGQLVQADAVLVELE